MKKIVFTLTFLLAVTILQAQTESFLKFKNKFSGKENVHCFRTNGMVVRTILGLAGEEEAKRAARHVARLRLVTVPRVAFEAQQVTVSGFKKVLKQDSFEEILQVRDGETDVTIYLRDQHDDDGCYMVLVEGADDIALIELIGYLDKEYIKSFYPNSHQKT